MIEVIIIYQKFIKNQAKNKFIKVINSDDKTLSTNINILLTFLDSNLITKVIIDELRINPNYTSEWNFTQLGSMHGAVDLNLPKDEEGYAALSLSLLEKYANDTRSLLNLFHRIARKNYIQYFNNTFTKKLMEYIDMKIDEGNIILYILNKYKVFCEWFCKEELMQEYINNTSKGEELLTKDLRKYLFNQGIDFPFSEPSTPSGKPDLVYGINTQNPLALEVKLFGGTSNYSKDYIKKGFKQAYHYAKDYNEPYGYLLIFNLGEKLLSFNLNNDNKLSFIEYGNKIIFLIVVNLNINESASKNKDLKNIIIDENYLIA